MIRENPASRGTEASASYLLFCERPTKRCLLPPYLLILGGMSSGSRRYGLHAWRFLFQFGRALLRINREHSPGSRCSGDPTDVRPRVAGLVVSQALWICSLQGGTTYRLTADLAVI